jgi:hypothetical protein|tara:strand:+ start:168 stop:575 length:408 start_codon:yes stop_codon:yes gene_type:complete
LDLAKQFTKQIIQDDIDLVAYDQNDLRQWLVANFINVLCDNKIFVTKVESTPIKDPFYKCLYEIAAILNNKVYRLQFGILYTEIMQVDELKKVEFERVSLAFYNRNSEISSIFRELDQLDFCITKLDTSRVIIIG